MPDCPLGQPKRYSKFLPRRSTSVLAHPIGQIHGKKWYTMYHANASPCGTGSLAEPDTARILLYMPWTWRDEVKRLMKAHHPRIRQLDLVPVLGVGRADVSHYLNNTRQMSVEQFYALLKHLEVEARDLFEPSTTPDPTRIARRIASLPEDCQETIIKVTDCLTKCIPWDEKTERRIAHRL